MNTTAEQLRLAAPLLLCLKGDWRLDTLRSSGFFDVLFEIRKRHKAIGSTIQRFDASDTPDVQWITVKGTHVPIDRNGVALAGGKLTGKKLGGGKGGSTATAASKAVKPSIGDAMKPKSTDYTFNPASDNLEDFVSNNVDKLMSIYKSGKMPAVHNEFYKYRLADTSKNLHEVTTDEAGEAISSHVSQSIKDGWMREANSAYKPKLVQSILSSDESRNAALNLMYENFKYYNPDTKTSFEEFLDTPVTMYRGGHGQKHTKDDIFSAYSFDRKVAEKFAGEGGNIYTAKIRPIDTYGSLSTNGESEIFVPTYIAPNGNKDSAD